MSRREWIYLVVLCLMSRVIGASAAERVALTDDMEMEEEAAVIDEPDGDSGEYFIYQPAPRSLPEEAAREATGETTGATAARTSRSSARSSYARLARAPNMFGDSFGRGGQLAENAQVVFIPVGGVNPVVCRCGTGDVTDLPGVGGGVIKVAENNKPLPMDRVYFVYNGFQNALTFGQPVPRDTNVNRYTVGLEKTFADGLWSLNVGMPFTNSLNLNTDAFTVDSGSAGNLALFLKRLTYSDDFLSISAGLGISLPTGSDLTIQTHQFNPIQARTDVEMIVIHNQAVHLVPYIGFLSMPNDDWFYQGFLNFNFAANGNSVDLGTPAVDVGTYTPQNLLHIDLSLGRWLVQTPDAYYMRGIAAIAELHYTSTIQDTDTLVFPTQPDTGSLVNGQLTNLANQTDILNLTAGLQFQIGGLSNLRVAGVVPLQDRPYRDFDFEMQISFNRNF